MLIREGHYFILKSYFVTIFSSPVENKTSLCMGNFLDSDIGQCNRVDNVNEYQLNLHGNHAAGETEETLEKDDTVSILIHLRFSETDKGPLLYPCSFQLWGGGRRGRGLSLLPNP